MAILLKVSHSTLNSLPDNWISELLSVSQLLCEHMCSESGSFTVWSGCEHNLQQHTSSLSAAAVRVDIAQPGATHIHSHLRIVHRATHCLKIYLPIFLEEGWESWLPRETTQAEFTKFIRIWFRCETFTSWLVTWGLVVRIQVDARESQCRIPPLLSMHTEHKTSEVAAQQIQQILHSAEAWSVWWTVAGLIRSLSLGQKYREELCEDSAASGEKTMKSEREVRVPWPWRIDNRAGGRYACIDLSLGLISPRRLRLRCAKVAQWLTAVKIGIAFPHLECWGPRCMGTYWVLGRNYQVLNHKKIQRRLQVTWDKSTPSEWWLFCHHLM